METGQSSFAESMRILTTNGYQTFGELCEKGSIKFITKDCQIVEGNVYSNGVHPIYETSFYHSDKKLLTTQDNVFLLSDDSQSDLLDCVSKKLKTYVFINSEVNDYCKLGFIQNKLDNEDLVFKQHYVKVGKKESELMDLFKDHKRIVDFSKKSWLYLFLIPENITFDHDLLPKEILNWELNNVQMFLKGLFSAYGTCYMNQKRVTLRNHNNAINLQVQDLLLAIGIQPRVHIDENGNFTCLSIEHTENLLMFAEKIGFIQDSNNKKLREIIGKSTPKISNVEYSHDDEVFNFELNDDCHWGVIEGVIAHNSNY